MPKIYKIEQTFYGDYAVYVDANLKKVRDSLAGGSSWIILNIFKTFAEAEKLIKTERDRQGFKPKAWIYD